jgi:alpha-2-macroglobulin
MTISKKIAALAAFAITAAGHSAWALQITSLSPQGEVAQVRQVVVKFDQGAVSFGDPKAASPVNISCSDAQASKGSGRWISEREWAYEFENDLPPGVRCAVQVASSFKGPKAEAISGNAQYAFSTGGPFVRRILPSPVNRIDEEQFFVLELSGAAAPATVASNVWCTIEGVGERVNVKMIEGNWPRKRSQGRPRALYQPDLQPASEPFGRSEHRLWQRRGYHEWRGQQRGKAL